MQLAPHDCSDGSSGLSKCNFSGGFETANDGSARQDFQVGLNFNREFSGVTVALSATYDYLEAPSVSSGSGSGDGGYGSGDGSGQDGGYGGCGYGGGGYGGGGY